MRGSQLLPPLLLSPAELIAVTGYRVSTMQIDWLRKKGWNFEINGSSRPIVARKHAETMLGCARPEQQSYRPNFGALRGT